MFFTYTYSETPVSGPESVLYEDKNLLFTPTSRFWAAEKQSAVIKNGLRHHLGQIQPATEVDHPRSLQFKWTGPTGGVFPYCFFLFYQQNLTNSMHSTSAA